MCRPSPPRRLGSRSVLHSAVHPHCSEWGDISRLLSSPPHNVEPDSCWCIVLLSLLFSPLLLLLALLGTASRDVYCYYATMAAWAAERGRRVSTWFIVYLNGITGALTYAIRVPGALTPAAPLHYFLWEWEAFGRRDYWWHFDGPWMWRHAKVHAIMRGAQRRTSAIACSAAPIPDVWASRVIIFLSNAEGKAGSGEWRAIRGLLHRHLLSGEEYTRRRAELPRRMRGELRGRGGSLEAGLKLLSDRRYTNMMAVKGVFYVLFGIWLEDAEARPLLGWYLNYQWLLMPRFVHRMALNIGVRSMRRVRREQAALFEKYPQLKKLFVDMNMELSPQFRRTDGVELMDQLMYAIGIVGICAVCNGLLAIGSFFSDENEELMIVKFEAETSTSERRVKAYLADKEAFIREVWRLCPPIPAVTALMNHEGAIYWPRFFGCFGKGHKVVRANAPRQLVISMANRDAAVFLEPKVFRPSRPDLHMAVTWNGCFGKYSTTEESARMDEAAYPRICPGRYLSLDLAKAVVDAALGLESEDGP